MSDAIIDELRKVLTYRPEDGRFIWRPRAHNPHAHAVAGSMDRDGYIAIHCLGKRYRAHRLAWLYVHGEWPTDEIDHINGKRDDNRIENLRIVTRPQNKWNSRISVTNKTGLKGVVPVRSGKSGTKWRAQIKKHGVTTYLGWFDSPEAAHTAYVTAAACQFGEFANDGMGG